VLRPGAAGRLTVLVAAVVGPVHMTCLAGMMTIWQHGASPGFPLAPLDGAWLPGGGPLLPLAVAAAGCLLLAALASRWCRHSRYQRPITPTGWPRPAPPAPWPGRLRLVARPGRVGRPALVQWPAVVRWPAIGDAVGGWRLKVGRVGVGWHIVGGDGDDPA
jgi:hypothetical protein